MAAAAATATSVDAEEQKTVRLSGSELCLVVQVALSLYARRGVSIVDFRELQILLRPQIGCELTWESMEEIARQSTQTPITVQHCTGAFLICGKESESITSGPTETGGAGGTTERLIAELDAESGRREAHAIAVLLGGVRSVSESVRTAAGAAASLFFAGQDRRVKDQNQALRGVNVSLLRSIQEADDLRRYSNQLEHQRVTHPSAVVLRQLRLASTCLSRMRTISVAMHRSTMPHADWVRMLQASYVPLCTSTQQAADMIDFLVTKQLGLSVDKNNGNVTIHFSPRVNCISIADAIAEVEGAKAKAGIPDQDGDMKMQDISANMSDSLEQRLETEIRQAENQLKIAFPFWESTAAVVPARAKRKNPPDHSFGNPSSAKRVLV